MNLFIFRAFAFVMGLILVVGSVTLAIVRQEPSNAYWLIDNGTNEDQFPNGLYRMMPDGGMRSPILENFAPRANTSEMYWIAGRAQFLFPFCEDGDLSFIRLSVMSARAEKIETSATIDQSCPWEVLPSPNGEKLLMRIFDGGSHALVITDIDGSNPVVLTETFNSIVGSEIWSPDSKWVYFGGYSPNGAGILRTTTDGQIYDRMVVIRFMDSPMWSSDGNTLTFITNGYFHQLDLETGEYRQITDSSEAQYEGATWVNDEWIITVGSNDTIRSLFRMGTDGTKSTMLIRGILSSRYVATSDGRAVVLAGETNAQALFGVNVETRERWSITPTGFWFSDLILSKDEEWVFFASTFEGANAVYAAKIDGSEVIRLYEMEDDDRNVNLQMTPDARWLLVSYMEDNVPIQRQHRVRINLRDGRVERLPDGSVPLASPLIDLAWGFWVLMVIGGLLMTGSFGLPILAGYLRQQK